MSELCIFTCCAKSILRWNLLKTMTLSLMRNKMLPIPGNQEGSKLGRGIVNLKVPF